MAGTTIDKAGVPEFIDMLVVFIKKERVKVRVVDNVGDEWRKEANSS